MAGSDAAPGVLDNHCTLRSTKDCDRSSPDVNTRIMNSVVIRANVCRRAQEYQSVDEFGRMDGQERREPATMGKPGDPRVLDAERGEDLPQPR